MPATTSKVYWPATILLLVYIGLLTKQVVFKKNSVRYYKQYFSGEFKRYAISEGWQKANTVPFRTIKMYYKGYKHNNANASYNLLGNLLGFIPLGILLPLALPFFRRWWAFLPAALLVPLGFETLQLITGLGIFDVDDLLLNTAGAVAGYILLQLALWFGGVFTNEKEE
jgi:glycopeptide antibiotics resistance protein